MNNLTGIEKKIYDYFFSIAAYFGFIKEITLNSDELKLLNYSGGSYVPIWN